MTKAVETALGMLESLPEAAQDRVVERLSKVVEEARDEAHWDELFTHSAGKLAEGAREARRKVAEGKAKPMDYDEL